MKRAAWVVSLAGALVGCNALVGNEELVASPAETAGAAGATSGAAGAGTAGQAAGQAGAPAGQAGASAGQAGASAGQAGTSAGQAGDAGQAGTSAGQAGDAGQAGASAGQAGDGGQAGTSGGQAGDTGQAGASAGQAGAGQAGGPAGQAGAGGSAGAAGQGGGGAAGGCASSPISHLVSWWHFDRVVQTGNFSVTTPIGDHHDVMGRNPGKSVGNVAFGPGVRGNGLAPTGNGHVSVPHSSSLALSKISIEAWVTVGSPGPIASKNTAGLSDAPLLDLPGQTFRFVAGSDAVYSVTKPTPGSTVHVVGTYDGATLSLYLDGVLDATKPSTGPAVQNTLPLFIGADHDPSPHHYGGMIDEVRIWDDALTPAQVAAQHAKSTCAVIDAVHIDLSGHAVYEETCPNWIQIAPTLAEPGFSGFLSHTYNGCGSEVVPFLTRYMNATDAFPYFRFDTTAPFVVDRLTFEVLNNFENYKSGQQVSVEVELGPEGEADPLAAGFTKKGAMDAPQPWTTCFTVPVSLGALAPGKHVVRLRPDVTPTPSSAFLGVGELHAIGTVQ